jgi:glycosyltransferase involved in cell wall biosynthesis
MKRLRIAVLVRHFGSRFGGAERYAVALVEALATRHEIHVFAQTVEHAHPNVQYHCQPHPAERPRWLNLIRFGRWAQAQTAHGFDVIHSHENLWFGHVQTFHVRTVKEGLWGRHVGFARQMMAHVQAFTSLRLLAYLWLEKARVGLNVPGRTRVAASALLAHEIQKHYPFSESEAGSCFVHVIPPGVDRPERRGRNEARSALGLSHDAFILLFVGNDYARKGLKTALDALEHLKKTSAGPRQNSHLYVVGDGAQRPRFEAMAREKGLIENVCFAGSQTQMGPWYEAADILIHPTREDSFGMVVLEAMAFGCPVILSPSPWCGLADGLTDPLQAVLLAHPHDAQGLAQAILHLRDHEDERQARIHAALAFAQAQTWEDRASQYEALYCAVSR